MLDKEIKKQQDRGFYIIVVCITGALASMWALDALQLQPKTIADIVWVASGAAWMVPGCYGIGYTVSGHPGGLKGAKIFLGLMSTALVIGLLIGFLS